MSDSTPASTSELSWSNALTRPDLLAAPVIEFLRSWPAAAQASVSEIDPELSDTAQFCERYGVGMDVSANCVVLAGKREGQVRYAACVVLATDRADVNGAVKRILDVRKASFTAMDDAVSLTSMEYGGITPVGLPGDWRVLIAQEVFDAGAVVIGSGVRRSKLLLDGRLLAELPNAEVVPDLTRR
jgi:prolyl-tRNA editing enzyme YbaK/EbsC (Cys-tRNA(Pro) deacylase)